MDRKRDSDTIPRAPSPRPEKRIFTNSDMVSGSRLCLYGDCNLGNLYDSCVYGDCNLIFGDDNTIVGRNNTSQGLRNRHISPTPSEEDLSSSGSPRSTTAKSQQPTCVVCAAQFVETIFFPCKHLCCCLACADKLCSTTVLCPVCRSRIEAAERAYIVG